MNKTAWAHLPNAAHIDCLLSHFGKNQKKWHAAADASYNAWKEVQTRTQYINYLNKILLMLYKEDDPRNSAWNAALGVVRDVAHGDAVPRACAGHAAWDAITALIIWDDSAHFLEMTPVALRCWIMLSGDPAALFLLPAVMAMDES